MTIRLLSNCKYVLRVITASEKVAIIHHWDTDGIASSVLIANTLMHRAKELLFHVPKIGFYTIESIDIERLGNFSPNIILILDYGISLQELKRLESILDAEVAIIDHHINEVWNGAFCNPIAFGYSESLYPSTTWIIKEFMGIRDANDVVTLGLIGDLGKLIESHRLKDYVLKTCREYDISLTDFFKAVNILDSCYKLIDKGCIEHAREVLMRQGIKGVLSNEILNDKLRLLRIEIEHALKNINLVKDHGIVKVFNLLSDYYVTSHIGREIAYRFKNNIIVLKHSIQKLGLNYIYVRSYRYNLRNVLEKLRHEDLCVGGKDHVFVITCMSSYCKELDTVLKILTKYFG